jgi:hypothetical protein
MTNILLSNNFGLFAAALPWSPGCRGANIAFRNMSRLS